MDVEPVAGQAPAAPQPQPAAQPPAAPAPQPQQPAAAPPSAAPPPQQTSPTDEVDAEVDAASRVPPPEVDAESRVVVIGETLSHLKQQCEHAEAVGGTGFATAARLLSLIAGNIMSRRYLD